MRTDHTTTYPYIVRERPTRSIERVANMQKAGRKCNPSRLAPRKPKVTGYKPRMRKPVPRLAR